MIRSSVWLPLTLACDRVLRLERSSVGCDALPSTFEGLQALPLEEESSDLLAPLPR